MTPPAAGPGTPPAPGIPSAPGNGLTPGPSATPPTLTPGEKDVSGGFACQITGPTTPSSALIPLLVLPLALLLRRRKPTGALRWAAGAPPPGAPSPVAQTRRPLPASGAR